MCIVNVMYKGHTDHVQIRMLGILKIYSLSDQDAASLCLDYLFIAAVVFCMSRWYSLVDQSGSWFLLPWGSGEHELVSLCWGMLERTVCRWLSPGTGMASGMTSTVSALMIVWLMTLWTLCSVYPLCEAMAV